METALVALYNYLCWKRDRGSVTLLILLDLSAAFNNINHGVLLDRLAELRVGGNTLRWFHSFMADCVQEVVLGDSCSGPWCLCHGVPQGLILSPMLFNTYMKPLGEVIRRFVLRSQQYADDTQLCILFSTNPGEPVSVLNLCLDLIMDWMRVNKLKLNPDKRKVLLVGTSLDRLQGHFPALNGVEIPLRDRVCSLGVLLDPGLSLEAQVDSVARGTFLQLWKLYQLRPYLGEQSLMTVTHALVTSHIDYCNALYVGLPLKMVQRLQLVQNRAAWLASGGSLGNISGQICLNFIGYHSLPRPNSNCLF
ncbi:uncharacterized protein LOC140704108 [Pogona vitticeps]